MTLPLVLADHGGVALAIASAVPVLVVGVALAFIMLRDRRASRRERRREG